VIVVMIVGVTVRMTVVVMAVILHGVAVEILALRHRLRAIAGVGGDAHVQALLLAGIDRGRRLVRVPVRVAHGRQRRQVAARGDHRGEAVDDESQQRQHDDQPRHERLERVRGLGGGLRGREGLL
jgi:hypothetical protein